MSELADLYRRPAVKPAAVATPAALQAPGSLAARLEREIREGRVELPVLPRAAVEVQELIARDADLPSIVRAIEREPAVAAALVKYANAAVYAGLRDVTDLQQAVARLGLDQVRVQRLGLLVTPLCPMQVGQVHLVHQGGGGVCAPHPAADLERVLHERRGVVQPVLAPVDQPKHAHHLDRGVVLAAERVSAERQRPLHLCFCG